MTGLIWGVWHYPMILLGFLGSGNRLGLLLYPINLVLSPLTAWLSRRHEYQSDAYSVRLHPDPGAMRSALLKLNAKNLSNLFPHPLFVAFHYSHPPLLARLAAIDALAMGTETQRHKDTKNDNNSVVE